jgi:hypothetical protein
MLRLESNATIVALEKTPNYPKLGSVWESSHEAGEGEGVCWGGSVTVFVCKNGADFLRVHILQSKKEPSKTSYPLK